MEGIELEFTPGSLAAVARQAVDRGTGARGLRSIMERIMLDLMYELPGNKTIARVTITEKTVSGDEKPDIEYRKEAKTA